VVAPGLYRGPVVFDKPVMLRGEGEVVPEARSGFRVTANACRLEQLAPRRLDGANPVVRSNRVFASPIGVEVEAGASATLERNELNQDERPIVYPESGRHRVELIDNVMEPGAGAP
jgi:hypothetical protein